jgi:3-oxoacyl-[acyl-carrier-protein] synthase-1
MNEALRDARLEPADIGMIVAHGNGTRQSDASESVALRRVFGNSMPPITAVKWSIGHLIAAAGIVETAVALEALAKRIVPGVATLNTLDPDCGDLPVSTEAQVPRSDTALVLCRGFAGTDAAVIIRSA